MEMMLPFIGIGLLIGIVALAVHPMRERMVTLGESLLAEPHWTADDRACVNRMLDSSMSFMAGALLPVAIASSMLDTVLRRARPVGDASSRLAADSRYRGVLVRYVFSLMASNPVLTVLLTIPAALIAVVVEVGCGRPATMEIVEEPALRAAARMAPVHCSA